MDYCDIVVGMNIDKARGQHKAIGFYKGLCIAFKGWRDFADAVAAKGYV
jgi:hypothetical protein